jgi:hypothetical protein
VQGGNADGVIDEKDTIRPKLRLWIDTHCYKDPEVPCSALPAELYRLPDKGIHSLSLIYGLHDDVDKQGNDFRFAAPINAEGKERQKSRDGRVAMDVFMSRRK